MKNYRVGYNIKVIINYSKVTLLTIQDFCGWDQEKTTLYNPWKRRGSSIQLKFASWKSNCPIPWGLSSGALALYNVPNSTRSHVVFDLSLTVVRRDRILSTWPINLPAWRQPIGERPELNIVGISAQMSLETVVLRATNERVQDLYLK
jgi:hypothetical protein